MKRTDFTYGHLDKVLRSLGFTRRVVKCDPPVRRYEHKETGAEVGVPPFPFDDLLLEYHLISARFYLDQFGIADPEDFEARLYKAARRRVPNRTRPTYGQLDKVLRLLGFTCRPGRGEPPARVYRHRATGARVTLPAFPSTMRVLEHHLVTARVMVDGFGVADAKVFDAKLQRAAKPGRQLAPPRRNKTPSDHRRGLRRG